MYSPRFLQINNKRFVYQVFGLMIILSGSVGQAQQVIIIKYGQFFLPLTFSVYSPSAIVFLIFIFISNILRFLCSVVHIPRSIYLYFHFRIYYIPLPNGCIYHTAKLAFCRQPGINIDSRLEGRGRGICISHAPLSITAQIYKCTAAASRRAPDIDPHQKFRLSLLL